jgi:hypothetical protein
MNATHLYAYVNQNATLYRDGLRITVRTLDARVRFGSLDVLVTPVAGSGEIWVTANRLIFEQDDLNV